MSDQNYNLSALFESTRRTEQLLLDQDVMIRQLLTRPAAPPQEEAPISIKEAAKILLLSEYTIRVNVKQIPHRFKHGKYYFFRSELIAYINEVNTEGSGLLIPRQRPGRKKKNPDPSR